jgi:hypothetical protein
MLKNILFGIAVILSVLAVCLCTLRLARADAAESWAILGKSMEYCAGLGFHYEYFTKWEEVGATLQMTTPDGTVGPYFGPQYQYTCEVSFMSQPGDGGLYYAIGLHWKFFTPEAVAAWEDLVENSNAYFCKHSKPTHIHGFTKITYPMGFVKLIDCEKDAEES